MEYVEVIHKLFSFAFGVSGLKHTGGGHEVLDVLPENLVLRFELEVLLLHRVHTCREIFKCVLELQHLVYESHLLLLLDLILHISINLTVHGAVLVLRSEAHYCRFSVC